MTIAPFVFTPSADALADLRTRLARRRRFDAAADPHGAMGIDPAALERLAERFAGLDWDAFAGRINALPGFIHDQGADRVHFVHLRSADPAAVPLLLLHGWPGSYLEFMAAAPLLAEGTPGFHVVCPSLPGYGFSSYAPERIVNCRAMADAMVRLMTALGYPRFIVQGGDWGSIVAAELARHHPQHCIGVHLNMVAIPPPPADDPVFVQVTPEEAGWLAAAKQVMADGFGYYAIQSTRPQTLAAGLSDSPLGLLAWIGEKFLAWSDRDAAGHSLASDAAIVDHAALYWLTNSIGSSIRLYHDEAKQRAGHERVTVPTGIANFPAEIMKAPRAWADRGFAIVDWTVQPRGGHFAALEVPELFVGAVRGFAARLAELPR